ncbi:MAG: hypothetical protein NTW87_17615 [Planctomycetota bacterium]|nr:hypothetical protein [Planctomycetota bacterium]
MAGSVRIAFALGLSWLALAAGAREFAVAPSGGPNGDGSKDKPWDLKTALSHPAAVKPGDTIWLRGGTYRGAFRSDLKGTANAPITVRACPGESVRIDGSDVARAGGAWLFVACGQWTTYWGFEITDSSNRAERPAGFDVRGGEGNKFINLLVHDAGGNGFWGSAVGNELYGCLFYNNGVDSDLLSHELYTQNADPAKPKRVVDCMFFNSFGFCIHAYAGKAGPVKGYRFIGNAWFNSAVAHTDRVHKDDILVGAVTNPEDIVLEENMSWVRAPSERSASFGRYGATLKNLTLTGNYFVGSTLFENKIENLALSGNTFCGPLKGVDTKAYPDNTYLTAKPKSAKVFVRPNQYEPGRAHIIVYNWDMADAVPVDAGKVLGNGDKYEVRNAQNYFAGPVLAGTYTGAPLLLPMTGEKMQPAQPVGPGKIEPAEMTGKEFNVFVLLGTKKTQ